MRAPGLARLLIRVSAPRDIREDTLGDLEEMHRRRMAAGATQAWCATVGDAVLIAAAMCWRRLVSVMGTGDRMIPRSVDVRLAVRLMHRQPLLTLTATIALTVGIAVATVGFALMDALLYSRLPFDGGDRFVFLQATVEPGDEPARLSPPDYAVLAGQATALEHLGGITGGRENVTLPSGQVTVATVGGMTPSTWRFVPHELRAGRAMAASDGTAGAGPVALVREGFWTAFAADTNGAVGSAITIGGLRHDVVGVVPDTTKFPNSPDVWVAVGEGFLTGRSLPDSGMRLLGILAPGASLEALQAQLDAIATGLTAARAGDGTLRLAATRFTDLGRMGRDLAAASVIVVLAVLLVIAANVGNLILARSFARSREFALRSALGASRARLVSQVFLEVLIMTALATTVGTIAARTVLRLFNAMDELPFWVDFSGGPRTFVLVTIASLLAAVIAGISPALRATRAGLVQSLEQGGGRGGDLAFGRIAGAMVVSQIAVSIVLLHGALVVAQAFEKFSGSSLALPRTVVTSYLSLDADRVPQGGRPRPVTAPEIAELLARLPGVEAVGIGTALPRHSPRGVPVQVEPAGGQPPAGPRPAPEVAVSSGYFAALDARVLGGRVFTKADFVADAPPVAVINEPFARKFFGVSAPLGRRFRVVSSGVDGPWREVVGVVPDLGMSVGDDTLAAGYYVPLPPDTSAAYLAVRTAGDPMSFASPIREALMERDPAFVVNRFERLEDVAHEDRDFFKWFSAALLGVGVVTLVLALAGVYAMMSLIVTRRTREIGVRMALGAGTLAVVRAILGRAGLQVAIGGVAGAVLALLSLNLRSALVSRLGTGAAWTLPAVLALLIAAGLLATWLPLRRALRVQASDALRAD